MAPAVSIIMPVHNAAETLRATLASIQNQSCTNYQLIAVDDGSTDESLSILLKWASSDPRIQVISKTNGGVSAARNFGAEYARAPYLAFIDADDLWHTDKLAAHLWHHARRPNIAASFAVVGFIPEMATSLCEAKSYSKVSAVPVGLKDVLGDNPVCTSSNFFVNRQAFEQFGGFDQSIKHAEDQEFLARTIDRGGIILGLDRLLVGYRFSQDGLSMDLEAMYAAWRCFAPSYLSNADFAAMNARYLRYLARRTLRSGGETRESFHYALSGLRADHRAFLSEPYRGFSTIAACTLASVLPPALRRKLFA